MTTHRTIQNFQTAALKHQNSMCDTTHKNDDTKQPTMYIIKRINKDLKWTVEKNTSQS